MHYENQDQDFIDYDLIDAHEVEHHYGAKLNCVRGPLVTSDRYITCLGAAQTFGRYVERPFPFLLSASLGIDVVGIGQGGAGPAYWLRKKSLFGMLNRSRVVVLQVLSGRSASCSGFTSLVGKQRGVRRRDGETMLVGEFVDDLIAHAPHELPRYIKETRADFLDNMLALLDAITAPTILLWFSVRSPAYEPGFRSRKELWRDFPQLVDAAMVDALRPHAERYVEVVSTEGMPQVLHSKRDASVTRVNTYYPSPRMHREAAAALEQPCRELLETG